MKTSLLILFLIIAVGFFPGLLFAKQASQDDSGAGMYAMQGKAANTDMMQGGSKGKMSKEEWKARHEKFQQELKAMDQRLDEKVAAMNAAQGDQKMAAMSNVINEMASQRKEFENMFKDMHGRKTDYRGKGSSDTGSMMKDSVPRDQDKGLSDTGSRMQDSGTTHQDMGLSQGDMPSPARVD